MSLLEEFIFALSKSERQRLRPLQFRGVKRRIFLKILNCRTRTSLDTERMLSSNKLTRQRYNQMLSEMLAACYKDVAPRGGIDLLQFLGNKQLFRHHFYEMKRQEAQLIVSGKTHALEQYYVKATLISEFFMVPPGNAKILAEGRDYLRRYIAVKRTPDPNDHYLVRIEEIDVQIERYLKGSFNRAKVTAHIGQLQEILDQVAGTHPFLEFMLSFKLLRHYLRLLSDIEKAHACYARGLEIIAKHPHLFEETKGFFQLQYELEVANMIGIAGDLPLLDESKVCRNGFPLRFLYHYFPIMLKKGDFQSARRCIQHYFPYNPDLLANNTAIYYWKLLMQYYIYTNNIPEGERCLYKALDANQRKTRNVRMEILFRQYEVFFVALRGNPVHAEEHIRRHTRYMHRHGYENTEFLQAVGQLIKCISRNRDEARSTFYKYYSALPDSNHLKIICVKLYAHYAGKAIAV